MGDSNSNDSIIETRRLTKNFGQHRAVDGLDLHVPQGTIFGLLGQNGAGKSTTIRMLLGLVEPSDGEVRLFGRPLRRERMDLLRRVGCLVEGPAYYPYLSGADNLMCLGGLYKEVSTQRVQECLDRVGLGERGKDLYRGYSTGMRQRLGIAGALLHDPELVILDEPLNGLDPPAVLLVRGLIEDLQKQGKTVFISSHLLYEVEQSCNEVAIMKRGKLVAQGDVADLIRPESACVDVTTPQREEARKLVEQLDYVEHAEEVDGYLRIALREDCSARLNRALVEGGVEVSALTPHKRTLEELFHELASQSGRQAVPEEAA